MALQIMASQNDQSRLILYGNGQVGPNFSSSQFVLEVDKKTNNLKFRNYRNFIAFDNDDIPCVLAEIANPQNNSQKMRNRNQFRLHEILGSEEHFTLESVYSPGRYLAVTPDGSITVSKNKTDESTYFCIHVIHVLPENIKGDLKKLENVNNLNSPIEPVGLQGPVTNSALPSTGIIVISGSKSGEADLHANRISEIPSAPSQPSTLPTFEVPPVYSSLFPQLPPQ